MPVESEQTRVHSVRDGSHSAQGGLSKFYRTAAASRGHEEGACLPRITSRDIASLDSCIHPAG